MKTRGFTLLELLAVIVVLAIIALIVAPIALKVIENSEKESGMKSFKMYLNAVDLAIAQTNMDGNLTDAVCTVKSGGNLECDLGKGNIFVEVDIKNRKEVKSGTIVIAERDVVRVNRLRIGDYIYNMGRDGKIASEKIRQTAKPCIIDIDENGLETVKCGTESFYVIAVGDDTVTMLTKYNLDVGNIYEDSLQIDPEKPDFPGLVDKTYSLVKNIEATPTMERVEEEAPNEGTETIGENEETNGTLAPITNPTGLQSSEARGYIGERRRYGVSAFSETNYWYNPPEEVGGGSIKKSFTQDESMQISDANPLAASIGSTPATYDYVYNTSSLLYTYLENYETYLKNHKLNSADVRLMNYYEYQDIFSAGSLPGKVEEALDAVTKSAKLSDKVDATPLVLGESAEAPATPVETRFPWLISSSYWLGSAQSTTNLFVVNNGDYGLGNASYETGENYGVRPVVTISKSEIDGEVSGIPRYKAKPTIVDIVDKK